MKPKIFDKLLPRPTDDAIAGIRSNRTRPRWPKLRRRDDCSGLGCSTGLRCVRVAERRHGGDRNREHDDRVCRGWVPVAGFLTMFRYRQRRRPCRSRRAWPCWRPPFSVLVSSAVAVARPKPRRRHKKSPAEAGRGRGTDARRSGVRHPCFGQCLGVGRKFRARFCDFLLQLSRPAVGHFTTVPDATRSMASLVAVMSKPSRRPGRRNRRVIAVRAPGQNGSCRGRGRGNGRQSGSRSRRVGIISIARPIAPLAGISLISRIIAVAARFGSEFIPPYFSVAASSSCNVTNRRLWPGSRRRRS